jgi:hypothetical protein
MAVEADTVLLVGSGQVPSLDMSCLLVRLRTSDLKGATGQSGGTEKSRYMARWAGGWRSSGPDGVTDRCATAAEGCSCLAGSLGNTKTSIEEGRWFRLVSEQLLHQSVLFVRLSIETG